MEQAMSKEHGREPTPLDSKGLCLLSLDGGGVRGLSTLLVLKRIMDRLNDERKSTANLPPVKPCEVFDLIGGTSTGGLIAIMLGRLEMDVDECITEYTNLAEAVFSQKQRRLPIGWTTGDVKARFDSSKLEDAVRKTMDKKGISNEAVFNDGIERGCRTFVCTIDYHTKAIVRLRSYKISEESNIPATICQAALATSAATTFFEPVCIGNRKFADGGLGANNPVGEVEGEAANIWDPEDRDLKPLVKCFISIGTGKPGIKAFEKNIFKFLGQTVVDIATETDETEKKFIANWGKHFDDKRYFRFNVDQGLQDIGLEEYKKQGPMEAATDRYLINQAQKSSVRDCIRNLSMKQTKTDLIAVARIKEYIRNRTIVDAIPRESRFIYPSNRVHYFVTRTDPITAIYQCHQTPLDNTIPTVFVLLGMGGCGKTQLALEYCRRGENDDWFSAIFWLDASSPITMRQSFTDIARKMSKPIFDIAEEEQNVQFVLRQMKAWKFRWLLIFDNFDDPSSFGSRSIKHYFPQNGGSILVTSRHTETKNLGLWKEVVDMSEDEALKLLYTRSQVVRTENNIQEGRKIVERLAYHALAIDQAGAYILSRSLDLDLFLKHYNDRKEKILEEKPEIWDYRRRSKTNLEVETELTVFTTWELSLNLICGNTTMVKDKVHLLTITSFLNSREVSDGLFKCYGSKNVDWLASCMNSSIWDKYVVQDMLKELRSLSLIQTLHIGETETKFSLHPLIHDWIKLRLTLETRLTFASEAVLILSTFLESHNVNHLMFHIKQALLSHLMVVSHDENEYKVLCNNQGKSKFLDAASRFSSFLESQGQYKMSTQMTTYALQGRREVLGPEHPSTLTSMNNLAGLLQSQGKYDEAEPIYQQVL